MMQRIQPMRVLGAVALLAGFGHAQTKAPPVSSAPCPLRYTGLNLNWEEMGPDPSLQFPVPAHISMGEMSHVPRRATVSTSDRVPAVVVQKQWG
jgi:hypothetical protein